MELILQGSGDPKKGALFMKGGDASLCLQCTVLVLFSSVYTSCFQNTVVSCCCRLHTSCLHDAGVTSCFSLNMWFQFILEMSYQSVVHEREHRQSLSYGQFLIYLYLMGLYAKFIMREVAFSANTCSNCYYDIYLESFGT